MSYCRCNGPDVPVATPDGPRPIADLAVGDPVYSVENGAVVSVPVEAVITRAAPLSGFVLVEVEGGRSFVTSAAHPLAGGLTVGALAGSERVVSVSVAPRPADWTTDILPASESGAYFVEGIVFASTLGGDGSLTATRTP